MAAVAPAPPNSYAVARSSSPTIRNCSNRAIVIGLHFRCRDRPLRSRPTSAPPLRRWEAGRLKPLVAKVFPLAEAGKALTALLSRRYAGKIVLQT